MVAGTAAGRMNKVTPVGIDHTLKIGQGVIPAVQ